MHIPLSHSTRPKTITRAQAATQSNRSQCMIDKAIKANHIDYGTIDRAVLVVANAKYTQFIKLCAARDWLKKRDYTNTRIQNINALFNQCLLTGGIAPKEKYAIRMKDAYLEYIAAKVKNSRTGGISKPPLGGLGATRSQQKSNPSHKS